MAPSIRKIKPLVRTLWAGEIPLSRAFWEYALVGGLLVNLATTILFMALLTTKTSIALLIFAFCLPIPYNVLMLVAVWRSAGRYQGRQIWADLARSAIVIWMIGATAT